MDFFEWYSNEWTTPEVLTEDVEEKAEDSFDLEQAVYEEVDPELADLVNRLKNIEYDDLSYFVYKRIPSGSYWEEDSYDEIETEISYTFTPYEDEIYDCIFAFIEEKVKDTCKSLEDLKKFIAEINEDDLDGYAAEFFREKAEEEARDEVDYSYYDYEADHEPDYEPDLED